MREVAIIGFAQPPSERRTQLNDAELVMPAVTAALEHAGVDRHEVGFTISGSSDFLTGTPFSFVSALDAVGAWPPIQESHLEMDGAFALYEAWIRLQHGDIDTALVYAFGRSSLGDLDQILTMQLDPYYLAPLGIEAPGLAGLSARALFDCGRFSELELAAAAERVRPRVADGAAAIVLAAGDRARSLCRRPAWISRIDHRIEPHSLGARDLSRSPSTRAAAGQISRVEAAELHAPFPHEELILRESLGLGDDVEVRAWSAPMMVAGLGCLGHAAQRILDGRNRRTLGHATSGPCLQQNLVCLLEARS